MIQFKSIPFFKILLPYVLGICILFYLKPFPQQHSIFIIVSVCTATSFIYQKYSKENRYYKKWLFIICVNLFLGLAAFEVAYVYDDRNSKEHYSHFVTQEPQKFLTEIIDIPVETERGYKIPVSVKVLESQNVWHYVKGQTILYLKKDSTKNKYHVGDEVLVSAKFSYVNQPQNPYEFDYKTYLQHKNIFHVVFVKPQDCCKANKTTTNISLSNLGVKIKTKVVSTLRESGLSQDAFAICAALLVGYDDEIDKGVMQSFSHSGTLHILSVSGMHTGVLYGILVFLFSLFDKQDQHKKLKCFSVIACLTLFAFITGFSPSVLRAVLMLALVLLGKTFYRQGNSYNTLLLSAFILLLINPYLLLDVGFLLSYLAVFGIMYLYPILNNWFFVENKLLRWAWSLTLMSLSATIFTLPVSLYYFHQFPIWFVFSNLFIISISTGLMLGAVILLFTSKIIFLKTSLAFLINHTNSLMLWFAKLTDNPDYGFIDNISFSKIDMLFCFICIILTLIIIQLRQYKHVMMLFVVIISWITCSVCCVYDSLQQKELVVFSVKHKPCFLIKTGQIIYAQVEELSKEEFQRFVKPYLVSNPGIKLIKTKFNQFNSSFTKVCHANNIPTSTIADYVIVSHNTTLHTQNYINNKTVIIADCSNSYTFVKKLKKQCAQCNIPFYSVKEQGALRVSL